MSFAIVPLQAEKGALFLYPWGRCGDDARQTELPCAWIAFRYE